MSQVVTHTYIKGGEHDEALDGRSGEEHLYPAVGDPKDWAKAAAVRLSQGTLVLVIGVLQVGQPSSGMWSACPFHLTRLSQVP